MLAICRNDISCYSFVLQLAEEQISVCVRANEVSASKQASIILNNILNDRNIFGLSSNPWLLYRSAADFYSLSTSPDRILYPVRLYSSQPQTYQSVYDYIDNAFAYVFRIGGDMSTFLATLSILSSAEASPNDCSTSISCWNEVLHGLTGACASDTFVKFVTASVDIFSSFTPATCIAGHPDHALISSFVPLIRVSGHDGMRFSAKTKHGTAFAEGHAFFSVPDSLCNAGWSFLSSSAVITVTSDWMRKRSCFSFSRAASAKSERFRSVVAFRSVHPTMERVLRL